jgi:hypothetical protein
MSVLSTSIRSESPKMKWKLTTCRPIDSTGQQSVKHCLPNMHYATTLCNGGPFCELGVPVLAIFGVPIFWAPSRQASSISLLLLTSHKNAKWPLPQRPFLFCSQLWTQAAEL